MKKSKQTPEQIVDILRTVEQGTATGKTIGQCVRELGISEWTYYRWRKQYAGMNKADAKKLGSDVRLSLPPQGGRPVLVHSAPCEKHRPTSNSKSSLRQS